MNNCPCRELADCKKQIAEMQAEMVVLSRRNLVCGTVFDSMRAENKQLREQLANSAKIVRCEKCKHRMRDDGAANVQYICKHPRGLSRINKDCYCSFGEEEE